MKKKKAFELITILVIFTISVLGLYAEAPELRNVMPNNWRKVTKLTANEERAFVRENRTVFAETKEVLIHDLYFTEQDVSEYKHYSIYKQQVGTDTFYRVLWTENGKPDFLSPHINFLQNILYKGVVVSEASYFSTVATQNGDLGVYNSIDIIHGKEKAKGILKTYISTSIELIYVSKIWYINSYLKGQSVGSVYGYYYLMEEALKKAADKEYSVIEIRASSCLIDPKIPLRYGLQNAFDGDPSTNYVENTENDLIWIDLSYARYKEIEQIAIINGYAQDMDLYIKNNRVKEITFDSYPFRKTQREIETTQNRLICKDNMLNYQYFIVKDIFPCFTVIDVFRGSIYNDTCIAELNFKTKDGWLFGDIE
jgi:hypothetical protein